LTENKMPRGSRLSADLPRLRLSSGRSRSRLQPRSRTFLLLEVVVPPLAEPVFRGPKKTTRFAVIDYSIRSAERKTGWCRTSNPQRKTVSLPAAAQSHPL